MIIISENIALHLTKPSNNNNEIFKVKIKRDQKPPNKITDFFKCQLVRGLKTKILRLFVLFLFLVVSPVVDVIKKFLEEI